MFDFMAEFSGGPLDQRRARVASRWCIPPSSLYVWEAVNIISSDLVEDGDQRALKLLPECDLYIRQPGTTATNSVVPLARYVHVRPPAS